MPWAIVADAEKLEARLGRTLDELAWHACYVGCFATLAPFVVPRW